jgi:hypothetical protein
MHRNLTVKSRLSLQIEDNDFVETMATKLKKRFDEKVAELTAVQTELFELKKVTREERASPQPSPFREKRVEVLLSGNF